MSVICWCKRLVTAQNWCESFTPWTIFRWNEPFSDVKLPQFLHLNLFKQTITTPLTIHHAESNMRSFIKICYKLQTYAPMGTLTSQFFLQRMYTRWQMLPLAQNDKQRMVTVSALDQLLHLTHWRWANLDDLFGKNIYNIRNNWMSFHWYSLSSCFLQNKNQSKHPSIAGFLKSPAGTSAASRMGTTHTPSYPGYEDDISRYFWFRLQYNFQLEIWPA